MGVICRGVSSRWDVDVVYGVRRTTGKELGQKGVDEVLIGENGDIKKDGRERGQVVTLAQTV